MCYSLTTEFIKSLHEALLELKKSPSEYDGLTTFRRKSISLIEKIALLYPNDLVDNPKKKGLLSNYIILRIKSQTRFHTPDW